MSRQQHLPALDVSRWDVIVLGAGTAGIIAAIQSAREGAKTVLCARDAADSGTVATIDHAAWPVLAHGIEDRSPQN